LYISYTHLEITFFLAIANSHSY